jgi:asparagine synthase (glutamine-hydrolysing)
MCGIAGFIGPEASATAREDAVRRMCTAMYHRGPDDNGLASRSDATIGGCRLAIFDPANGHQPMVSPDGRWTLVFNGAIYNYKSLRVDLAASGWEFRTDCDTEVLLAAIARWGTKCLPRLRGMFAFAAWDEQERTLLLARDPFGIKPLYFQQLGGKLLFASELNALLASGIAEAQIDPYAVVDYLAWFAVSAPRTIYHGIFSLRPGEYAVFQKGKLEILSAWTFRDIPEASPCGSYDEFIHELRARLEDTIRAHMLADVPVGAFLSGGLDSAAVVGLMTRVSGTRLRTFSIGFDEPGYSEATAAAATARHFGSEHQAHVLTGAEVVRDLDKLLGAFDQPTGDGINTYYASQIAHQGGVTVALSGLGGDELFGGYPAFRDTPRLARWLPWWRAIPNTVRRATVRQLARGDTRRRKLADVLAHASNIHEVGALQRRVFSDEGRSALLNANTLADIGPLDPFHLELDALSSDLANAGAFEIVSAWELRTYMADLLLRDSDVMSMRHSLELRVPFIDRPFIEWLWRQPAAWKSQPNRVKSGLAEAVRDLLPEDIFHRQKHGFTLPFAKWMRRELRPFLDHTFSDHSVDHSGLFARAGVQTLWRGYLAGTDTREWSRVWSLAVLIAFINRRTSYASSSVSSALVTLDRGATEPTISTPAVDRSHTLLLAPEIYSSEGGIPRILQLYLKALCESAGPDRGVRLVALNDYGLDATELRQRVNGALEESRACGRSKTRFVRETLEMARGCDTIVCGHIRQLPIAWLAQRLNPSLKYYLVAHGIEVWRHFNAVERKAMRGAERIFCVSDYTRRELLKNCPLPDGRAIVLHNALDPYFEIGPGLPLAECPPTILVVTRITYADRYKGVETMIEAMPAILATMPDAKLRIVGRGDDVQRLQRRRDELGITDAVEFTGYLDDARLAEEMRACRLFALPSRKEGFGLVFLEAMAHGRPCLGARAGGIPEVITDDSGVLVEYGDIAATAQAVIDSLERTWDESRILARARDFSFTAFKQRLATELAA